MNDYMIYQFRRASLGALLVLAWLMDRSQIQANPVGGVVSQGSAGISSVGSQLTVNQTSSYAAINWQSFNIGAGETTTFNQPSATSVAWNHINDSNPSLILGDLNANGYVVLQNQNGFVVGGQAVITAHGLVMTTSPTTAPDLSSGGAWSFDAPPPSAKIINYGKINIGGGGSAFLIADDIENDGAIAAPDGKIGLYAGEKVLVSMSPDGRGLSAQVTLPQGSVNNEGKLIADGGTIAAQAQTVNQNGFVQANSVKEVNGTIELVASDSVNLGSQSVISAQGDSTGASAGGTVTVKSDNTFSDQAGSVISVAGGAGGGNGGALEISAPNLGDIDSQVDGHAAGGFLGGAMTIDPTTITLDAPTESSYNSLITGGGLSQFTVAADTINITSSWTTPASLSQLILNSTGNINLSAAWTLAPATVPSTLTLSAGNNIICNSGSDIVAPNNWSLDLYAGTALAPGATPPHISDGTQSDGIYLLGSAYVQTQNGDINCTAPNEVLVNSGAVRTLGGGEIDVTALYGNVNTGTDSTGYSFYNSAPYYTPFSVSSFTQTVLTTTKLGGISTAAGGNVNISAGGNVTSYFASGTSSLTDPGAGAFGPQPGNVTITAGGSVFGDYVVANGVGSITAGQNIGTSGQNVALSLVKGGWNLNAPDGNIYLQEVRNPNGVFGGNTSVAAANHYFDYDPQDYVDLNAGVGVYLTGTSLPRNPNAAVQIIYPPILDIIAGSGGVNLQNSAVLFPSIYQNLDITTTDGGILNGYNVINNTPGTSTLSMSDTSTRNWGIFTLAGGTVEAFSANDIGSAPLELNNLNPVVLNISGDMDNIKLSTDKETRISVGGNMYNCSFSGQNLHSGDVTSINVVGKIINPGSFTWDFLSQPIQPLPATDWSPTGFYDWTSILYAAVKPNVIAGITVGSGESQAAINATAKGAVQFSQGYFDKLFTYDTTTQRLTLVGPMSPAVFAVLSQPLTVLVSDGRGNPLVVNGKFVTDTVTLNWVPSYVIQSLYTASQSTVPLANAGAGYIVGGPGQFDVQASSISLGNSQGILTLGVGANVGINYKYLAPYTPSGADLNVTVTGSDPTGTVNGVPATVASLDMPASAIAALGGGNVNVTSTSGSMDLGSQDLLDAEVLVAGVHAYALGIFTSGPGDVNVSASGDINIDSSRVGAFDGGNINVESYQGNVNAGSGGANASLIETYYVDPRTGLAANYQESIYANGIAAESLADPSQVPGAPSLPGNITVTTPQGDIIANQGGILQEALDGNTTPGPTINLMAGTFASGTKGTADYSPGYVGNIVLGDSGVIGGSVFAAANGNITGLVISRQNSNIQAAQNFSGTVLAGGSANLSAGGNVSGTVVGLGGVSASGGSGVSASLLGNNVSVNGGAAQNTLGTSASATSASQSAAQQSSNEATQQVASNSTGDDDEKKKKKKHPLLEHIKRVTVILPKST